MKDYIIIKNIELISMMKQLELIFDVVRLVDPEKTNIVTIDASKVYYTKHKEACFSVWEKNQRCNNCISLKSCADKKRITKFEFRKDEVYHIISMPVAVENDGKQVILALELVNKITQDSVIHSYGRGSVSDEIAKFSRMLYDDSLTGVYNRRYYEDGMYLFDMTNSFPKKIGFIMIDIKRFKDINDKYGHAIGDSVLRGVARGLKKLVRKSDAIVRIGGDEFLIILRNCDEDIVISKQQEIKRRIKEQSFAPVENGGVEINAGYSYTNDFDGAAQSIRMLFEAADKCMYEDKSKK